MEDRFEQYGTTQAGLAMFMNSGAMIVFPNTLDMMQTGSNLNVDLLILDGGATW